MSVFLVPEHTILSTPSARRSLKKLPKSVKKHLLKELQILKHNPTKGEKLNPPLGFLRSLHTRFKNSDYRVVYEVIQVIDKKNEILVHFAASRENFYKQLLRLNLKPQS
jgi:mRNA-degrading endonuclease RelE of RelBE toxin-antitoxin system